MKRRFENNGENNVKSKPICKFFVAGKCTKNPCSFRHVAPRKNSSVSRNFVNIRERVESSMERFHEEKQHLLNLIQWYKLELSNSSEELKIVKKAKVSEESVEIRNERDKLVEKIDCLEAKHQDQYKIWQAEKESLNNRIRNNFEANKNLNQKHRSHLQNEASKLTNLQRECLQKEANVEKMRQNVLELQEKCDVQVNQTKFLQTENESLKKSLEAMKKHSSGMKKEIDVVSENCEKLRENESSLKIKHQKEVAAINSVVKSGEKLIVALSQEKSQLEEKLRITSLEGQSYVGQLLKQFEVDCKQYQKDILDLKLKNTNLELRIEELSKHQDWSKQILQSIE